MLNRLQDAKGAARISRGESNTAGGGPGDDTSYDIDTSGAGKSAIGLECQREGRGGSLHRDHNLRCTGLDCVRLGHMRFAAIHDHTVVAKFESQAPLARILSAHANTWRRQSFAGLGRHLI